MTHTSLPTFDFARTGAIQFAGSFHLNDIYTKGVDALKRRHATDTGVNPTWNILDAYVASENAIDPETRAPDFDKILWDSFARLYVNAADITLAAIEIGVVSHQDSTGAFDEWFAWLDLGEQGLFPFIHLYRTSVTAEEASPEALGFAVRKTGSMGANEYVSKFGGYALSVHPTMARRAPPALVFMVASGLQAGGLVLDDSWMPQDTSEGFARYHFTDGLDTMYMLDFDGPALTRAMAIIDAHYLRTEDEGAVIIDSPEPDDDHVRLSTADADDVDAFEPNNDPDDGDEGGVFQMPTFDPSDPANEGTSPEESGWVTPLPDEKPAAGDLVIDRDSLETYRMGEDGQLHSLADGTVKPNHA